MNKAAVFEITILCENILPIGTLFESLKSTRASIELTDVHIMDNWEYENQFSLKADTKPQDLTKYLLSNKIVTSKWHLNSSDYHVRYHSCGHSSEVLPNNASLTEIWVSTLFLPSLDVDCINKENLEIYEMITNYVVKLNNVHKIKLCGMGVETAFKYDKSVRSTIEKSHNINRWIFYKEQAVGEVEGFDFNTKGDFIVLSKFCNEVKGDLIKIIDTSL